MHASTVLTSPAQSVTETALSDIVSRGPLSAVAEVRGRIVARNKKVYICLWQTIVDRRGKTELE